MKAEKGQGARVALWVMCFLIASLFTDTNPAATCEHHGRCEATMHSPGGTTQ